MKEMQDPGQPYPSGNRNGKMNPLFSAWEVSGDVYDPTYETEFYQEGANVPQKCESLDERNIVISCHLMAQAPLILGQGPEGHSGGDLSGKTLPVMSPSKVLNEQKNKKMDMSRMQTLNLRSNQSAGRNLRSTSPDNARVRSLTPLAQTVFSAAYAEPRKEMALERNQELLKPANHHISAGSILWPQKTVGFKTRGSSKLLDPCPKSTVTRGHQRARSRRGSVSFDEAGPVSRRSSSMVLGDEAVKPQCIYVSLQRQFEATHRRSLDCGWGPTGYCLRQPICSGVTQGRILPSTHLYLWEREGRDFSRQACSQFKPFVWKSEGDDRRVTGPSGHPADSQPDSTAGRLKDIRCQLMRMQKTQNPEPPPTHQWRDRDFTMKHILQALQCL